MASNEMNLINPTMTIANAEGPHWLVSFAHNFGNGEHVVLSVKVLKSDQSLVHIEKEAFDRATELLKIVAGGIPSDGTP